MLSFANSFLLAALALASPSDGAEDRASAPFSLDAWTLKRAVLKEEAVRLAKAFTNFTARASAPSENAVVPIEMHFDGSIKLKIEAKRACLFPTEGYVLGSGVTILGYEEDGVETTRIEAEDCIIDRTTKSGWAQGPARFRHGKTVFVGEDLFFSSPEQYLMSFHNSQVESSDMMSGATLDGRLKSVSAVHTNALVSASAASNQVVRVRACTADFDRAENVALFTQDVRVDYLSEYQMTGDQLYGFLSASGLNRLVALGNVTMTNDLRSGACDRVIFRREAGEVEMFGKDSTKLAHLQDQDGSMIDGTRIKFWLDREQVEVVDSVLTVKTKDKGALKNL